MAAAIGSMGGSMIGGTLGLIGSVLQQRSNEKMFQEMLDSQIVMDPAQRISAGLQLSEFQNLSSLGLFDPTSLLQASPVQRLIGAINASGESQKSKRKAMASLNLLLTGTTRVTTPKKKRGIDEKIAGVVGGTLGIPGGDKLLKGLKKGLKKAPGGKQLLIGGKKVKKGQKVKTGDTKRVQRMISAFTPYNTFEELMQAEQQFQMNIEPLMAAAQEDTARNLQHRRDLEAQTKRVLSGLPDTSAAGISELQGRFQEQLLREIGKAENRALSAANFGNFNPGAQLEQFEEFRHDSDLAAMQRAMSLIGGQQGLAAQELGLLRSGLDPASASALMIAGSQLGRPSGQVFNPPSPVEFSGLQRGFESMGSGIASAGNAFDIGSMINARTATAPAT
jgi:hypothetical protein